MKTGSSCPRNPRERAVWHEYLNVTRDEVAAACCGTSRDRVNIVRETIISIGGVEAGHAKQVLKNLVRQIAAAKLLPPLFQWDINIGNSSTERV